MSRVRLPFTPEFEVEFCDRVRGIKQVYEFGERSTRFPIVVFGPEGCGKTAWLTQSIEVLKELKFEVIYFNPLRRKFEVEVGIEDVRRRALDILRKATSEYELVRFIWLVIDFAADTLKYGRGRLAVIIDDAFQLLGVREATAIIKGLLELIEYPPRKYEKIVAITATSEGLSRREIGRHLWAWLMPMWNMSKEGFEELYDKLPGSKPSFEDIWFLTGGNPRLLSLLYQVGWSVDVVVSKLLKEKEITPTFISRWRKWLELAVEDPDNLWSPEAPEELINELEGKNLIIYNMYGRDYVFWIDEPPPEKDLELGIGKYIAWQTPIHREAVKKVIKEMTSH
jgi:hypothetical protein